jgi:lincosamide nucleotidyltransferase B/F
MDAIQFDNYTEQLRVSLESLREVLGLVVLGSTADSTLRDEWSDHDFWIISDAGAQDTLLEDLSWLPDYQNIALTVKHLPHGLTIVFHNRHKVEFAVFDATEMGSGRVERYRVLIDRGGIAELVATVHDATLRQAQARPVTLENLCVVLWSACERHMRGELLSARQYMDAFAIDRLLSLISNNEPADESKNTLDPRRRLEQRSPELAAEVIAVRNQPVPQAALHLLEIAERELKPKAPDLAWDKVKLVRDWIWALPQINEPNI